MRWTSLTCPLGSLCVAQTKFSLPMLGQHVTPKMEVSAPAALLWVSQASWPEPGAATPQPQGSTPRRRRQAEHPPPLKALALRVLFARSATSW